MKKIISCILVLMLFITICITGTNATTFEEELTEKFYNYCVDYCVNHFGDNASDFENWDNTWGLIYSTKVRIFEYTQADDIVYFSGLPSWIALEPMSIIKQYGNWQIYSGSICCPSELALYVMIGDRIYTIEEAWEQGLVTDLTPVEGFSKCTIVTRINESENTEPTSETINTEPNSETQVTEPASSETQSTSNPAVYITLTAQKTKIYVGETTTVYWSVSDENMTSGFKLTSSDTKVATVSSDTGKVKGVGEGTAVITASVSGSTKSLKITVAKRVNPMKVTTAVKAVKYSTVKKKAITVKPITVSKAQGKVTYKKLSGNKKITVNTKTGKFTVKKGTKKSTYTIKVKVTAAGNTTYKSGGKTVTVKIKVK